MEYIDTHCHLHDPEFFSENDAGAAIKASVNSGVSKMIGIGTSLEDSKNTILCAHKHPDNYWASVGIHPHEASKISSAQIKKDLQELDRLASDTKVVAIGECGLDFYYNDRDQVFEKQVKLLEGQLQIAQKHNLPLSFHVREAFTYFWPIYDKYTVRGVLHSFTDRPEHLEKALERGLLIGINGIATFTSHQWQLDMFKGVPLEKIVVETDSPFLTPKPRRGTINTPENVIYITQYLAELRGEDVRHTARQTTDNARRLFGI